MLFSSLLIDVLSFQPIYSCNDYSYESPIRPGGIFATDQESTVTS